MIQLDEQIVSQIKQKIIAAKRTLLLAHKNPDGDTLGSSLAFYLYLKGLGKKVDIACYDQAPESASFLPGSQDIIQEFNDEDYDLVVSFDSADPKLSGFDKKHPKLFERTGRHINIDHHKSNLMFGDINLVQTDCASTTQILYYLFKEFKAIFTREISTLLLTGLYTDTGSFMHQNTTPDTLRVGAQLVKTGADVTAISKHLFNTKPVHQLRLWGRILNRAKKTKEGVVVSAITQADLTELGASRDHVSGAIEFLKYIPDIKYAEILTEEEGGKVKGSLRTIRDDVDVSAIAATMGGGGHVKAAGFSIPGKIEEEVQWRVVEGNNEKIF